MKKSFLQTCIVYFVSLALILSATLFFLPTFFPVQATAAQQIESAPNTIGRVSKSNVVTNTPFFSTVEAENNNQTLAYTLKNKDSISYERELALEWKEKDTTSTSPNANQILTKYFSFTFQFQNKNFTKLTITLETPSVNMTKLGKTSNAITFTKNTSGTIDVQLNGQTPTPSVTVQEKQDIQIVLGEATTQDAQNAQNAQNSYDVTIKPNTTTTANDLGKLGTIDNIDGTYTSYSSSTDTTIMPLKIECESGEGEEGTKIVLKELNGQSFAIENGAIEDNAPPVLCLNKEIYQFMNGTSFHNNFDYKIIDILSPVYTEKITIDDKEITNIYDNIYFKPNSSTKASSTTIKPIITLTGEALGTTINNKPAEEKQVQYNLAWYMSNKGQTQDTIPVKDFPEAGTFYPTMQWPNGTSSGSVDTTGFKDSCYKATGLKETNGSYQMALGSGAYFYFGDLTGIVNTELSTDPNNSYKVSYKDIQYVLYYRVNKGIVQSTSPNRNNRLSLEMTQVGKYEVIIVPQYKGIAMQVPAKQSSGSGSANANTTNLTITNDNVFTLAESNSELLPILEFDIQYAGPEVKNGTSTTIGYIDVLYTGINMKVTALNNVQGYTAKTVYSLYYFEQTKFDVNPTADEILSAVEAAFGAKKDPTPAYKIAKTQADYDASPDGYIGYLREIQEYTTNKQDKEGDNRYQWYSDSGNSFIPQEAGFYIAQANVTSNVQDKKELNAFQVISVQSRGDINPGENLWIKNNLPAIILFSISGLLLVALIVVIFIPANPKAKKSKLIGEEEKKLNTKK